MATTSQQPPDRLPADFFAKLRTGSQPQKPAETRENPGGSRSSIDVIRGSSNIPLSDQGRQEAREVAQKTKGQFSKIYSSTLERASETAQTVAKLNPKAGPVKFTRSLTPWFLGQHEGQPTEQVIDKIKDLILNHPNQKVPGRGPKSTRDGQSFNSFRRETLSFVRDQGSRWKPGQKWLDVTHYRDVRLMQAWAAAGFPKDLHVDTTVMTDKGDASPGALFLWNPDKKTFGEVDDASADDASADGIYFLRHGATAWNSENRGEPTLDTDKAANSRQANRISAA